MAADSKARIEAVAADLLARDGYNGMGLKAIALAASLPFGSIYHHFPGGKEEIAVAAITATSTSLGRLVTGVVADGVTPASIRAMFGFMADRLAGSNWVDGCPIGTPALDGSAESAAVRDACRDAFARMTDPIAAALVRQGHSRTVAREFATTFIATYEGATMLARSQRTKAPLRAAGESMVRLLGALPTS